MKFLKNLRFELKFKILYSVHIAVDNQKKHFLQWYHFQTNLIWLDGPFKCTYCKLSILIRSDQREKEGEKRMSGSQVLIYQRAKHS